MRWTLLLLLLLLTACPNDPDDPDLPDAGADASVDAGDDERDAGADARDAGSDAGVDSGFTEGCIEVEGDTEVAIDLSGSFRLEGLLTVDGQTPIETSDPRGGRGLFLFQGDRANTFAGTASTGPATMAVDLVDDTYDVRFASGICQSNEPKRICGVFPILESTMLTEGDRLDLDIRTTAVTLTFTVDGAPMAEVFGPRGAVHFAGGGTDIRLDIPETGVATISAQVPLGTYDLVFVGSPSNCDGAELPCNSGTVAHDFVVDQERTATIELPMVVVSGAVTTNGTPMGPADAFGRGALEFHWKDAGGRASRPGTAIIEATGDPTYSIPLLLGDYDVVFEPAPEPVTMPANRARIAADQAFSTDATFDIDLSIHALDLNVTLLGGALPDSPGTDRGRLRFDDGAETTAALYLELGESGAISRSIVFIEDTFRVDFEPASPGDCVGNLPCGSGVVADAFDVSAAATQTIDIAPVRYFGSLMIDGADPGDAAVPRGGIELFSTDTYFGYYGFSMSGPLTFDILLLPGSYDVRYSAPSRDDCLGGQTPGMACFSELLETIELSAETERDFSIETALLSGSVSVEGTPIADEGGVLYVYSDNFFTNPAVVGADGRFQIRVNTPGRYDLEWAPQTICDAPISGAQPCARHYTNVCVR